MKQGVVAAVVLLVLVCAPVATGQGTVFVASLTTTAPLGVGFAEAVASDTCGLVYRAHGPTTGDMGFQVAADSVRVIIWERTEFGSRDPSLPPFGVNPERRSLLHEQTFAQVVVRGEGYDRRASFVTANATQCRAEAAEQAVVAIPRRVTPLSGPTAHSERVGGASEPIIVSLVGPASRLSMTGADAVSAEAPYLYLFSTRITLETREGRTIIDPRQFGTPTPATVPHRWIELALTQGHLEFTPPASYSPKDELSLYAAGVQLRNATRFGSDLANVTVEREGETFNGTDTYMRTEGRFDLSVVAEPYGDGYRNRVEVAGSATSLRLGRDTLVSWTPQATVAASLLVLFVGALLVLFRDTLARGLATLLYTKLRKPTLLDHDRRQTLYDAIKSEPGISFLALHDRFQAALGRDSGLGFGSLAYHLSQLERFGLVVSKREGRYRRYFENGGRFGRDAVRIALIQTPPIPLLVRHILENPGASQVELHARLRFEHDVTRQSVGYHLKRLEEKELVTSVRDGRSKSYTATPKLVELAPYAGLPALAPSADGAVLQPMAARDA